MASEKLLGAIASNRDVPECEPGTSQDCRDVVHISVFFDGTGNNRDEDNNEKKWSNVARMFDSALERQDPSKGIYTIYISGVGTPYNGKAVKWLESAGVWVEDNVQGMAAGGGGERRLDQGDDAVNDRLRDVLIANAKALGGTVAKYAAAGGAKSFAEVNAALGKHRLIKIINLSIFGFSRGAALARAFSNRVIKSCKQEGGQLLYQGYPIRLNFMGVFDTVASFGVPAANVQLPFLERDLVVSPKIERCVHYVAAHEVRFAFPVDLIRKNKQLKGNWVEQTYPGVHSDVGGGYAPKDQDISNNYARIPMRDMIRAAVTSGVRMWSYDEVKKVNFPLFQKRFECLPETEAAYKSYMAACGPLSGPIEKQMEQHMKLLISAYGTMDRTGMETAGDRRRSEDSYKYLGPKGMAWEIKKYRAAAKAAKWVRVKGAAYSYAQYVKPQDWQIQAWDTKAPAGVVEFVSKYVHDSKVDFVGNIEPFSYFKPRGVDESTINIWQAGGRWLGGKAKAAGDAVEAAADTTAKAATKAYDASAKAANDAYDASVKAANEAAQAAKIKAQQAADFAAEKARQAYESTSKAATEAAQAAQHKAEEAANYANQMAKKAADTAAQTADQIGDGAQRIYEKGTHWVEQVAKGATDKISEAGKWATRQTH